MEIIKKSAGITSADLYALTKGNDVRKLQDYEGETLDVLKFVVYKDQDTRGNETTVLSMETVDGAKMATNSRTFIRNFTDIIAIYEAAGDAIPERFIVGSGISKGNRKYLTCDIAK